MNNVSFVGNLTRDPELRHSQAGKPRATFSVAINERWGDNDEEKTHFLNCTAFGTLGENVAASLRKGQRVAVVGRVDTYAKEVQIDGESRDLTMVNFIASAVGPDLRWATVEVSKVPSARSADDPYDDSGDDEAPSEGAAKPASRGRATSSTGDNGAKPKAKAKANAAAASDDF